MHLIKKKTNMSEKVQILSGSIFVMQFYIFFLIKVFNQGIAILMFFHK